MSKTVAATDSPIAQKASPASSRAGGLVSKLTILLLILAVILGECVAAIIFLGRGGQAAAVPVTVEEKKADTQAKPAGEKHAKSQSHAKGQPAKGHPHAAAAHGGEHQPSAAHQGDQKEVDLDEFSIMASDPAANTMLMVEFHMFGTIAAPEAEEFDRLYEENRHRIRHHVIITVRSAEMADLTDAGLTLLRRQLQDKINQLLGKPLLQEVLFSKFSFIEQ